MRHGAQPGRFLKGPIPWDWLAAAGSCGGHALHVAIALWHEHGCTGDLGVRVVPVRLRELGVSRHAGYRALKALAAAGLIDTERRRGRTARVQLLPAPKTASNHKYDVGSVVS
jgi:hypothetical protein